MKIIDYCYLHFNKPSSRFLNGFLCILFLFICTSCYIISSINPNLFQSIIWHISFYTPTIYAPIIVMGTILIYLLLLKREQKYSSFKPQKKTFTNSPLCKTLIFLLSILSYAIFILSILYCLYIICTYSKFQLCIFLSYCCPILLLFVVIYYNAKSNL